MNNVDVHYLAIVLEHVTQLFLRCRGRQTTNKDRGRVSPSGPPGHKQHAAGTTSLNWREPCRVRRRTMLAASETSVHVVWQAGLLKTIDIVVTESLHNVSQIWGQGRTYLLLVRHGNLGSTQTSPISLPEGDIFLDQSLRHTRGLVQDRIWIAPAALLPPRCGLRLPERDIKNL